MRIPTIEEVFDRQADRHLRSVDFFAQAERPVIEERMANERDNRYVCAFCRSPVRINGMPGGKVRFYFRHEEEGLGCPYSNGSSPSADQLRAAKYAGAAEGELHRGLKTHIHSALVTEFGIDRVWLERRVTEGEDPLEWRKPDVLVDCGKRRIAVEVQVSTTSLHVLVERERFYDARGISLLWVFASFSPDLDAKLTFKDLFYGNNRHAFVFDLAGERASREQGRLRMTCHAERLGINGRTWSWEAKELGLEDIDWEHGLNRRPMLRGLAEDRAREAIEKAYRERERAERHASELEEAILADLRDPEAWRDRGAAVIAARTGLPMPFEDLDRIYLVRAVAAIFTVRRGFVFGSRLPNVIAVCHNFLTGRNRRYARIFLAAVDYYQNTVGPKVSSAEWQAKVRDFRANPTEQSDEGLGILALLFPELTHAIFEPSD